MLVCVAVTVKLLIIWREVAAQKYDGFFFSTGVVQIYHPMDLSSFEAYL